MTPLSLQQCKDKVAQMHHNLEWRHLNEFGQASYLDEVCLLWGEQVKILAGTVKSDEVKEMMAEALKRLLIYVTDIGSTLASHNLSVVGWHLNGDHEPIMSFFDNMDTDSINEAQFALSAYQSENTGSVKEAGECECETVISIYKAYECAKCGKLIKG